MKKAIPKIEAEAKIQEFFKKDFSQKELKKIKRLAMKYKIKLGKLRQKFCKKCFSQLKGKTRITKIHKTIICSHCQYKNKINLKIRNINNNQNDFKL